MRASPVVTFDVFSALLDSRSGGARELGGWARERGWAVSGEQLYDRWDAANKRAHLTAAPGGSWVPYRQLARDALATAYGGLGLDGDPETDITRLLASMATWPLWPDVEAGLAEVARQLRVGVLSNIDDDLLWRTRVRHLPVDRAAVVTSERVRAYKPAPGIYTGARRILGPMVHVASSARDVRGALEAGLPVVRLVRPGHGLDPAGPVPARQAGSTIGLLPALIGALEEAGTPLSAAATRKGR